MPVITKRLYDEGIEDGIERNLITLIRALTNSADTYKAQAGKVMPAPASKIRKVEVLWDICYRLKLVGNPVASNLHQFEESLVTRLYKFCFVGEFNEENFTDEHLDKLKELFSSMTEEQKKITSKALESHIVGGFGFAKATEVIEKVFGLPLAIPERPDTVE